MPYSVHPEVEMGENERGGMKQKVVEVDRWKRKRTW